MSAVLVWISGSDVSVGGSGVGLWLWCGSRGLFPGSLEDLSFAGECLGVRCSGVIPSGAQAPLSVVQLPCLGRLPGAPKFRCELRALPRSLPWGPGRRGSPPALAHTRPCPCPLTDALFTFLGFGGLCGPC